ncbi:MAG TPA: GNAT family N-acetyltransferase [Gammaproteobacteria bacterium]|nr:GNAT family N-acetyltransferase [Gammaproteobacteria bacterium]
MSDERRHAIVVPWDGFSGAIAAIRERVFVREQGVPPELEWDGEDAGAIHVLAFAGDGSAVGTGRMLATGQIGRMAVLPGHRRSGIGGEILEMLIAEGHRRGMPAPFLHAQTHALDFYRGHGFHPEGGVFMDAGIPHRLMRRAGD